MATVTAFTAERSKQIEDNAIIDGVVVGDNLILKRFNGLNDVDAGNVRGPQGDQGPIGITEIPTGSIQAFAGSSLSLPPAWLLCNGTSIERTSYNDLFTVIGTVYGAVDIDHFTLPNFANRVPVGVSITKALGSLGGSENVTLAASQLPPHQHTIWHDHPNVSVNVDTTIINATSGGFNRLAGGSVDAYYNLHRLEVNIPALDGNSGYGNGLSSSAHTNMQPYVSINYLIKT